MSRPALLADPGFAELKSLVVGRTGHHYYVDKDEQLAERIALRMAASGIAAAPLYLERLRDTALGDREWRELESELTIKETFFFRFAEQFAALRTAVLPQLIEAREPQRRLRIWSAGCSTGAEPYSVAVVLSDLLGKDLDRWQLSILGTDIDEKALATARDASYGGWALRSMPASERERLFTEERGRWRLRLAYRGMVRFERLNILDLDGAAVPLQLSDYDLIMCRNMLIYFHPDQATRLVEAIGGRLARDGWLILGHAEAGLAMGTSLCGVETGGVVAYRRSAAADAGPDAMPPLAPPPLAPPSPAAVPAGTAIGTSAAAAAPNLDEVRLLLDAGDTTAAAAAIARLRAEGMSGARLFFLDAVCALGRGERDGAERLLRSALYLDGGFAMAHYLSAQVLMEAGRADAARRALVNAANALAAVPPDVPVTEGDGRTAAELREVVRARLAGIDAA